MDDLEERVRGLLAGRDDVREVRMFGSLCFMVAERLRVGVRGTGDLLVRTGADRYAEALSWPGARTATMKDRPMHGWVEVDPATLAEDGALDRWLGLSMDSQ